jgi:acetyl-CoA carboxylase, biotin carboxylase subunit
LGGEAVAVHSDADAGAKHVREADAAVRIGEAPTVVSYLNPGAVVRAALDSGAQAVHPGYGFLAENAMFARAVMETGLAWVGPSPEVLELAGDKVAAREEFERTGFPVLAGGGPFENPDEAVAAGIDYPVMVKAVMGGGGIGMGIARDDAELRKAVETAATRGERFFGDAGVYVERYVPRARHVEVQILADDHDTTHLYERECSVQRRHQKVVEETPSPALDGSLRQQLFEAAIRSMRAIGYRGAGTVECILTPEGEFFFLEVNARLQVEHPITEITTGVDLVEEQLRIAATGRMSLQAVPARHGHAIECRLYAEDPKTFLPSPGWITALDFGSDPNRAWRHDFGYEAGDEVPMFYDPLIGKVVAHGGDRVNALMEMRMALEDLRVDGLKTNLPALREIVADERFASGEYDTGLLGK